MNEAEARRPLDVLLAAMNVLYGEGRIKEAADIAKAAAPYVHPRAQLRSSDANIANLSDEELGLSD